jgi:predicted MFS family arabinose efflux permease
MLPHNMPKAYTTTRYRRFIAVLAVLTVMGALGFARFGYTMLLPSMKEGLGLSEVQAGDLATGNLAGYLALALVCGLLASRFGPRIVISVALVCVAAAMAFTGLAPTYAAALAARAFTGMSSAGANVPVMGLLSAWFVSRRRGLAGGIAVSGSSFGLIVTGFAIPPILQAYGGSGWRYAWFLLAVLTLTVAVLCAVLLRNGARSSEAPLTAKAFSRSGRPPLRIIFKTRSVWLLAAIYAFFGFSYIVYATFFVRYLTAEAGYTTEAAGALWSLVGALSIASGFIWGSVSDRLGRKAGLALVFFLQCASFSLFGIWRGAAGPYVSAFLFALTAWSIPAIMAAASGDLLGPSLAPGALGLLTFFFGLGQVAGPFVCVRIAASAGSYSPVFVIAGLMALAGSALSLFLPIEKGAHWQE